MSTDSVRTFLEERGCADDVIRGGLDGLVSEWERTVDEVARGYASGIDDYLTDLDTRQLIEEALRVSEPDQLRSLESRLRRADARMREHVRPVDDCLWGGRVAQQQRWTAEDNWWYFSVPSEPGALLRDDLDRRV